MSYHTRVLPHFAQPYSIYIQSSFRTAILITVNISYKLPKTDQNSFAILLTFRYIQESVCSQSNVFKSFLDYFFSFYVVMVSLGYVVSQIFGLYSVVGVSHAYLFNFIF